MSADETTQEMLRRHAEEFFLKGIEAVEPRACVFNAMESNPLELPKPPGRIFLVAIGKAAGAMMKGAQDYLRENNIKAYRCFLVTDHDNYALLEYTPTKNHERFGAGHPVPDDNGIRASKRLLEILDEADSGDLVLTLISGGGSALLPCPPEGIRLEHKIALNRLLLASGIDIKDTNLIRQQFSLLKGGRLVQRASPARVLGLLLSDVPNDDVRTIASGLTAPPLGTKTKAETLLKKQGLWDSIPPPMQEHLRVKQTEAPIDFESTRNILVGNNRMMVKAIRGAASEAGYKVHTIRRPVVGDIEVAAKSIFRKIEKLPFSSGPVAFVCGGEITVQLGDATGQGGRNQELAFRFAWSVGALRGLDLPSSCWVFLSGGSDGRDGPTDAAGGLVDGGSINQMLSKKLSLKDLLENHNSHYALNTSKDLLITGATGTNVADVQIFLAVP
ncbi:MAG: DUF4147 domain-containing protein [Hyphomicrobiales bacterium]|nr:DUF4147 domain-containing protein [Hyphomicrobiales bacterium]